MIDQLIQQLRDPDARVRRKAILAIGRSKDPAALKPLALIVRGDPDPELRELARKAGLYIRQQTQSSSSAAPKAAPESQSKKPGDPPKPVMPPSRGSSPFTVPITGALDADAAFMPPAAQRSATSDEKPPEPATSRFQQMMIEEQRRQEAELPDPDDLPGTSSLYTSYSYGDDPPSQAASTGLYAAAGALSSAADDADDNQSDETLSEDGGAGSDKVEVLRKRSYHITKEDEMRAKQYLDAALTLNMDGDNARAMKNLTSALGLDPRLIKDTYFNSVAASVTGLEGDEAVQMIADKGERKRFTQDASRKQKDRRVERHMDEALQSTWVDFWFELIIYALIVIIGPILATLVASESARNVLNSLIQSTPTGDLSAEYQALQASLNSLTAGSLLPIGIVSGLSGVFSLLLQTVLIHYMAVKLLRGAGTWRHLIRTLLGFYNKWFPILFFLTYITIAVYFISLGSPVILCFVIVLLILTLYVTGKTSSKVGEAYDFGGAMGCMTVTLSSVVILLINVLLGFMLAQVFGVALQSNVGGLL